MEYVGDEFFYEMMALVLRDTIKPSSEKDCQSLRVSQSSPTLVVTDANHQYLNMYLCENKTMRVYLKRLLEENVFRLEKEEKKAVVQYFEQKTVGQKRPGDLMETAAGMVWLRCMQSWSSLMPRVYEAMKVAVSPIIIALLDALPAEL